MKIKYVLPRCLTWAKLHLGSKSGLLVCLQGVAEAQSDAPTVTSIGLDEAITVQMKKTDTAKSLEERAHQVFIQYNTSSGSFLVIISRSRLEKL